ncbi:ubiquitin thioesterase otubain-like family protein [Cardiosporidium cionae]|uniref:ubiquitinyl hydrolase 1 n=1 Tax=Cardiosporidium cionae TaxID=476202 RepID=A0ABQ7J473_9APIC|nr:ubiquitin thioesterase otubain-like family protein [Cardiosporidium cionae]|eukprot:KAF8817839.1 ubiquitin thioesterase otubain-like family protein [Cardiosporidium cionae]
MTVDTAVIFQRVPVTMNESFDECHPNLPPSIEMITDSFVNHTEDLGVLREEFSNNDLFLRKIDSLERTCSSFRRVKKDGCCFYRAFLFGVFEYLVKNKSKIPDFAKLMQHNRQLIHEAGYTMSTIDDFYEAVDTVILKGVFHVSEFVDCLDKVASPAASLETVEEIMNFPSSTNYLVVFARLLTATHMKLNKESFEPFLVDYADIDEFCKSEVDPMYVEAEQLQVIALSSILQMPITIRCIDSSETSLADKQVFPDPTATSVLHLLYRPGHYDLIYEKE